MKNDKIKNENKKRTSIGGQAVIEGVMMRGTRSMATCVRDGDGIIRTETKRLTPLSKKSAFFRLPLVRGVVAFVSSLVEGTKVLMRSADVFGQGEPSKFEKWTAEKLKINIVSVVIFFSLIVGFALAVFLFMFLPQFIRSSIENLCSTTFNILEKNLFEGLLKILIFVVYIMLCSLIKDVNRTFMYHGAEHKTISCYEKGYELTVENAKKCTRVHDRCGTTFIVFVMVISIIVFALVEAIIGVNIERVFRILLKIALLPLVAGLSYELLKGLAKSQSPILKPLKAPGLLLQRLTTKEPDDDMLEVAICAFNKVMQMDLDDSVKEEKFVTAMMRKDLTEYTFRRLENSGIFEKAEAEWIVSICLGIKRERVYTDNMVMPRFVDRVNEVIEQRITRRPLWYCIGDTDFYGYKIKVDERVLIPRPETELLVENALKFINSDSKVLDLCTGSGAIAIAVKNKTDCNVTAIDISEDALTLAKENATLNKANIEFINSDLFSGISDRKFGVIISNPPYIKSEDIKRLQREVKDYEPRIALDGGEDGLDFYRTITEQAKEHLETDGVLLLECGYNQAQDVANMLKGYKSVEIIKDYENVERIVKAVL